LDDSLQGVVAIVRASLNPIPRHPFNRPHASLVPAGAMIHRQITKNTVEEGAQGSRRTPAQPLLPNSKKHFLGQVLRLVAGATQPNAVSNQQRPVSLNQLVERRGIQVECPLHEGMIIATMSGSRLSRFPIPRLNTPNAERHLNAFADKNRPARTT